MHILFFLELHPSHVDIKLEFMGELIIIHKCKGNLRIVNKIERKGVLIDEFLFLFFSSLM